jgi:hypothetical protein
MSAEASFGLKPWPSWSAVHEQFSVITTISVSTSSNTERVRIEFTWWIIPVLSLIYIMFFVLGEIYQNQRHSASMWIRRLVFKEVDSGAVVIPKYVHLSCSTPIIRLTLPKFQVKSPAYNFDVHDLSGASSPFFLG